MLIYVLKIIVKYAIKFFVVKCNTFNPECYPTLFFKNLMVSDKYKVNCTSHSHYPLLRLINFLFLFSGYNNFPMSSICPISFYPGIFTPCSNALPLFYASISTIFTNYSLKLI